MQAIWKYPVPTTSDSSVLEMPQGAEVLTVQTQGKGERPELWALVDPDADTEVRTFRTYGTGHPIEPAAGRYVATYQLHGGGLIFHVFEVGPGNRKALSA